jgi:hypothetical protein
MAILYSNFNSQKPSTSHQVKSWAVRILLAFAAALPLTLVSSMISIYFYESFNIFFITILVLLLELMIFYALSLHEGLFIIDDDKIEVFRSINGLKTREIPTKKVFKIVYVYSTYRNYSNVKFLCMFYNIGSKTGKLSIPVQQLNTEEKKKIIDHFYNQGTSFIIDSSEYKKDKELFPQELMDSLKNRVNKYKQR